MPARPGRRREQRRAGRASTARAMKPRPNRARTKKMRRRVSSSALPAALARSKACSIPQTRSISQRGRPERRRRRVQAHCATLAGAGVRLATRSGLAGGGGGTPERRSSVDHGGDGGTGLAFFGGPARARSMIWSGVASRWAVDRLHVEVGDRARRSSRPGCSRWATSALQQAACAALLVADLAFDRGDLGAFAAGEGLGQVDHQHDQPPGGRRRPGRPGGSPRPGASNSVHAGGPPGRRVGAHRRRAAWPNGRGGWPSSPTSDGL